MESCSNQKSKYILYLRLSKVANLCHYYSFAHSWHSLNQLHLECLSNSLKGVPAYAEQLLAAFPSHSNSSQPIPIKLRSGDCGGQVI